MTSRIIQTVLIVLCFGISEVHSQTLDIVNATSDTLLHVEDDGKVGIGTTIPATRLHVTTPSDITTKIRVQSSAAQPTATAIIDFGSTESGLFDAFGSIGDNAAADDLFITTFGTRDLVFRTNGSERMRIKDDGDVGIGTTTPEDILHLVEDVQSGNVTRFKHDNTAAAATTNLVSFFHRLNTDSQIRPALRIQTSFSNITDVNRNSLVSFSTAQSGTFQEAITIDGSDVGFGTTSPATDVHISRESGDTTLRIEANPNSLDNNDQPRLEFHQRGGSNTGFIGFSNGDEHLRVIHTEAHQLRLGTNNGVDMTIDEDGEVGIGTSTPNDALDVIGDIDATGCVQTNNDGSIGGTCVSDRRLKKNIISLSNSLAKISQLNPVRFQWREEYYTESKEQGVSVGLIAQELEEVFPHLVKTDENGYKRIRYDIELQMHMLQAIKELKAENDELKAKLHQFAEMEAKMAQFESALQKLVAVRSSARNGSGTVAILE